MGWKNNIGESNPPVIFLFFFCYCLKDDGCGSGSFTGVHGRDGRQREIEKKEGGGDKTHLSVLRVEMLVGLRDCFLNVKFQFRQDDIYLIPSFFFSFYLGVRLFKKRLDTPVDMK